ncbi:toll-like receptor Tollo [Tachypleus tridentatus]|uniref:toll-like receptor Tollo n=1 Tax=Tachypleus tridentatus TaxID=6853 RepID=UPI003FD2E2F7
MGNRLKAALWYLWLFLVPTAVTTRYVAPEDCRWQPLGPTGDDVALTCSLRTLNGAFDKTNFSLIQPEHTTSLTVRCEDVFFESSLANNSFKHLTELRSFTVEYCKLQEIPSLAFAGLSQLVNLTVRTHNSHWGKFPLEVSSDSFSPLDNLESLDLSLNHMESLPEVVFCGSSLKRLNLTYNSFNELSSLGFSDIETCKREVKHLEVSHNHIKVLSDRGFSGLPGLHFLNLQYNQIGRAEEDALRGLRYLHTLDISNNQLVALPPRFLQPTEQLSELYLKNNSISVLPPGLFSGLQQMVILDLSHNSISNQWIGVDTFADMIRLVILDLSHNQLTEVNAVIFKSQYSLQVLHLSHNDIQTIEDNAFSSLYNLHTLVLSHNRLTRINYLTLNGLHVLNRLALDSNNLQNIHVDAFRNSSNLMELNIGSNKLSTVPTAVHSLKYLRSLEAGNNHISKIYDASYQGLHQLYSLRLMGNYIGNLSKGVFQDLPSLRILDLSSNKIQFVGKGTFDDVPDLHALRLDSNSLSDINDLFSNLHDLLMLNVSANKIRWFDYALIPVGLQWLDLHSNQVESLGNYFDLETVLKLRTLDASNNKITELAPSSLPNGIEIVFLSDNKIHTIRPFSFLGKANLTRVDLVKNDLENLEMNSFRLTVVSDKKPLPEFSISGNPYLCDCNMDWLQRIGSLDESRHYPKIVDIDEIMCHLSFTRGNGMVPLSKVHLSQFLCQYKSHCFALCHCCDFDACDCEMVCPENCSCYYDQSWNSNIVDCSYLGHKGVPKRVPMDVTELYLDGNDVPTLSSHTFIGRKNMKVLYLNSSNVKVINNRTFNGLRNLQVLNLRNNRLNTLHGYEFERLTNLIELDLSYNLITFISNTTFASLKLLEILYLDHNYIVEFQAWMLNLNSRLQDLQLSLNPWTCECQFVQDFSDWLQQKQNQVKDSSLVQCVYNETTTVPVLEINITVCVNYTVATTFLQKYHMEDFMPMLIVIISLFVLLLFVVILLLVYRREMSVWFFTKYGVKLFQRNAECEEERLFDAFVSYSKKDEAFITQLFTPELEYGNPPYRLCLHYRDLPVGGYMSDAIVEAMESSRRTIVIISDHFLQSEWCRYEFKSAHHEVLRSNKQKVILIFLGQILQKNLDPDIRLLLKSNIFLRWGEKQFWEKLRYAMPDVRHRKCERTRQDHVSVSVHI